jgi:photosystem II stability/assembly factor-like uncharacterized protein
MDKGAMPALAEGLGRSVASAHAATSLVAILLTIDSGYNRVTGNYLSETRAWRTADGGASWQVFNRASTNSYAFDESYQTSGTDHVLAQVGADLFYSANAGGAWVSVPKPSGLGSSDYLRTVQLQGVGRLTLSMGSGRNFYTTSTGATWTELKLGGAQGLAAISGVWFFDRLEGLVVAQDGSSARTADGGRTWTARANAEPSGGFGGVGAGWHGLSFLPASGLGWVMSDTQTIYRSVDRGLTWTAPVPQTSAVMIGVSDFHFVDAQRGWAVSNPGYGLSSIFRSRDGGQSWQVVPGFESFSNLAAVRFSPDGQNGVAVGDGKVALVSNDGGTTWSASLTGVDSALRRLYFFADGNTVVAVGANGVVLRSTNRGRQWSRMATPTDNQLNDVAFTSAQNGWAVGDSGTILFTTDGGQTWAVQPSGAKANLQRLHFIDNRTGWAVGSDGAILVTVTGGT